MNFKFQLLHYLVLNSFWFFFISSMLLLRLSSIFCFVLFCFQCVHNYLLKHFHDGHFKILVRLFYHLSSWLWWLSIALLPFFPFKRVFSCYFTWQVILTLWCWDGWWPYFHWVVVKIQTLHLTFPNFTPKKKGSSASLLSR